MLLYFPEVVAEKRGNLPIRITYSVVSSFCVTDKRQSNAPLDALTGLHRMPHVGEALTVDDRARETITVVITFI
jgi:hypothetical protein